MVKSKHIKLSDIHVVTRQTSRKQANTEPERKKLLSNPEPIAKEGTTGASAPTQTHDLEARKRGRPKKRSETSIVGKNSVDRESSSGTDLLSHLAGLNEMASTNDHHTGRRKDESPRSTTSRSSSRQENTYSEDTNSPDPQHTERELSDSFHDPALVESFRDPAAQKTYLKLQEKMDGLMFDVMMPAMDAFYRENRDMVKPYPSCMNALSTFRDVMRKEFAVTKEVHEAIKSELLEELGLREGASVQEQRRSKGSPRSAPAERNRTLSVSPQRRKEEKKPRRTPPRSGGYDSWDSSPGNRRDRRQRSTWKQDMDCNPSHPPLLDQPMEGTSKRKFGDSSVRKADRRSSDRKTERSPKPTLDRSAGRGNVRSRSKSPSLPSRRARNPSPVEAGDVRNTIKNLRERKSQAEREGPTLTLSRMQRIFGDVSENLKQLFEVGKLNPSEYSNRKGAQDPLQVCQSNKDLTPKEVEILEKLQKDWQDRSAKAVKLGQERGFLNKEGYSLPRDFERPKLKTQKEIEDEAMDIPLTLDDLEELGKHYYGMRPNEEEERASQATSQAELRYLDDAIEPFDWHEEQRNDMALAFMMDKKLEQLATLKTNQVWKSCFPLEENDVFSKDPASKMVDLVHHSEIQALLNIEDQLSVKQIGKRNRAGTRKWVLIREAPFYRQDRNTKSWTQQILIPRHRRDALLGLSHSAVDAGHPGILANYKALSLRAWWPRMMDDIETMVNSCPICRNKTPKPKGMGRTTTKPHQRTKHWSIDVTHLQRSKTTRFIGCFTLSCLATRYLWAFPIKDEKAKTLIPFIKQMKSHYGSGLTFYADQGRNFISQEFINAIEAEDCFISFKEPYNPKANPVERSHRIFKGALAASVLAKGLNPENWDIVLPDALGIVRRAFDVGGQSAAMRMYGVIPSTSLDLFMGTNPNENFQVDDEILAPGETLRELEWSNKTNRHPLKDREVPQDQWERSHKLQSNLKFCKWIPRSIGSEVYFQPVHAPKEMLNVYPIHLRELPVHKLTDTLQRWKDHEAEKQHRKNAERKFKSPIHQVFPEGALVDVYRPLDHSSKDIKGWFRRLYTGPYAVVESDETRRRVRIVPYDKISGRKMAGQVGKWESEDNVRPTLTFAKKKFGYENWPSHWTTQGNPIGNPKRKLPADGTTVKDTTTKSGKPGKRITTPEKTIVHALPPAPEPVPPPKRIMVRPPPNDDKEKAPTTPGRGHGSEPEPLPYDQQYPSPPPQPEPRLLGSETDTETLELHPRPEERQLGDAYDPQSPSNSSDNSESELEQKMATEEVETTNDVRDSEDDDMEINARGRSASESSDDDYRPNKRIRVELPSSSRAKINTVMKRANLPPIEKEVKVAVDIPQTKDTFKQANLKDAKELLSGKNNLLATTPELKDVKNYAERLYDIRRESAKREKVSLTTMFPPTTGNEELRYVCPAKDCWPNATPSIDCNDKLFTKAALKGHLWRYHTMMMVPNHTEPHPKPEDCKEWDGGYCYTCSALNLVHAIYPDAGKTEAKVQRDNEKNTAAKVKKDDTSKNRK